MSSDDSGFDKEAEREKLREKYGEDRKDRESTQRMSELLLQGATMTGKHCGECGDPIFRYDGREFCPTCQREVEGGQAGTASQDASNADENAEAATETEAGTTETDTTANADAAGDSAKSDEPRVEIDDVRVADQHVDRAGTRRPPSRTGDGNGNAGSRDEGAHRHQHAGRESTSRRRSHGDDRRAGDADPGTARASLVRTLNDLARRAEESGDVARTRDLLAATREAAEALAALDRTDR